ncbi:hypothetical protein HJ015_17235 [Vibrio parahaemolyticus]|uniref:hypothetical protein n=1 Tax=Vibrio parahaemolyticus TaxID=670 RepID=UPI000B76D709|nr:hypothetical protein [Vibrio parahaemolyticus]EHK2850125.1 hypothetical protein [Vibrio parahaemolyticus]ELA8081493.1 hypothetical protein [Vibrio parahaemolyticus]ELA8084227.1 hypothetical protein [Vibrio parahaemolyticus]ELA8102892.1 hypothetical protein [Vibrio parahaemolyticus]MBE4448571.1 hypothetical protein [Vibrio parahaemolyticus]
MEKEITASDLINYIIELERFESTSLEDQVIEKALQSGFITGEETQANSKKIAWIKIVTSHAQYAYNLEAVVEGEPLEVNMSNLKEMKKYRVQQVNEIINLLAKHIINSTPDYPF